MKKLIIALSFVFATITNAQTDYQTKMQEAFGLWSQNKATEASQVFERIAKVEQNNWLPNYYAAQTLITSSFELRDEAVLKTRLEQAQVFLDKAKEMSPKNSEIMVAQAQLYTVWVIFDGASYGRKYSGKISRLYEKATKLDPTNPRAAFGKVEWDMGSARFFGKDTAPYCKKMEKAIKLFDTFENKTPFYPNFGKERALMVISNCK